MNKTTVIALKYIAGLLVTGLLFWNLYRQIQAQAASGAAFEWWPEYTWTYLIAVLILIPVNIGIESIKWKWLVQTAEPITTSQATRSVLGGIAGSVITPNRLGEYPARILMLQKHNSTRLISVSVLGAFGQMISIMLAGIAGMIYYCSYNPLPLYLGALIVTVLFTIVLLAVYFRFEYWAPRIEHIRWLKKLRMWGRLLHRFTAREQWGILGLSVLRLIVFTTQFYLMLRWQGIAVPVLDGFLLCALFFWAIAIIPSIALAELGVRGTVSTFLFKSFTANVAGVTAATFGLWCANLMLPAFIGAVLLMINRRRR